jgi:hypothetical protein
MILFVVVSFIIVVLCETLLLKCCKFFSILAMMVEQSHQVEFLWWTFITFYKRNVLNFSRVAIKCWKCQRTLKIIVSLECPKSVDDRCSSSSFKFPRRWNCGFLIKKTFKFKLEFCNFAMMLNHFLESQLICEATGAQTEDPESNR